MKFNLKTLAAAIALAAAAGGANAAIDTGAGGNGELFFSIWNDSFSYTRDLNVSIDAYQSPVSNQVWNADATFISFLGTIGEANLSSLKWSVVAADAAGARRLLTTYSLSSSSGLTDEVTRGATATARDFAKYVNTVIGVGESVAVDSTSVAFAGQPNFRETIGTWLDFSNAGTVANNSFATGLGFMRIDAKATGIADSVYTPYTVGSDSVHVWIDGDYNLHIAAVAAVPEPSEYALLIAGLGLMGAVARRRAQKQA